MRVVAALGGVLAAIALGVLAGWCWQRGVIVTRQDGVQLSRLHGSWISIAVAVATLAGIALINAAHHALLAIRPTPIRFGGANDRALPESLTGTLMEPR